MHEIIEMTALPLFLKSYLDS